MISVFLCLFILLKQMSFHLCSCLGSFISFIINHIQYILHELYEYHAVPFKGSYFNHLNSSEYLFFQREIRLFDFLVPVVLIVCEVELSSTERSSTSLSVSFFLDSSPSKTISLRFGIDILIDLDGLLSVVSTCDSGGLGHFGIWKNDAIDFWLDVDIPRPW